MKGVNPQPTTPSNLPTSAVFEIAEAVGAHFGFKGSHQGDVHKLAEQLGGRISYVAFDVGIDAESLTVYEPGDFEIRLPDYTNPERDTFTVGHELGHLFLHYLLPSPQPAGPAKFYRYGNDLAEIEANWFSSALLMPSKPFTSAYKKSAGNWQALGKKFRVSPASAQVRAKLLKLT